jgi:predicted RNase H-like nuclease
MLRAANPPLHSSDVLSMLLERDPAQLKGEKRKNLEDSLDAVVCAYIAFHYWYWEAERTEMFGTVASGYIANPKLLVNSQ